MDGPFNGSRIDFDTILECGFGPNSTPKASSKNEGYPSLIYFILALSLANVGFGFFPIQFFELSDTVLCEP